MTPEQLAKRILELDPDPAAIELAAHLKRQFDVGFNAGLEAARKVALSFMVNSKEPIWLYAQFAAREGIAEAISTLTVPSDLVAVPREPTDEMLRAMAGEPPIMWDHETNSRKYRAMIAASEERG